MTLRGLHLAILRGAQLLVPAPERAEWFAEWRAELWYVNRRATVFCLGSFRDAFWLRRNRSIPNTSHTLGLESPLACVLFLALLAAFTALLAFSLPLSRNELLSSPYRDARNLAMLSAAGDYNVGIPTVPIEQYQWLVNHMPKRFTALAFYRPVRSRVGASPQTSAELWVAVASANLFQLLEKEPRTSMTEARATCPIPSTVGHAGARWSATPLVLSQAVWGKYFNSDPHIVGRILEVAGQPAVVSGVIDADIWRLPGQVDAWLLREPACLAQLPPQTKGFVLGRLAPRRGGPADYPGATTRVAPTTSEWSLSVPNQEGGSDRFTCSPLAEEDLALGWVAFCSLFLLVLLTVTPRGLGEYPRNRYAPTAAIRLRRWVFLAVKIALLVSIALFGCLDLASVASFIPPLPPLALAVGLIGGCRWALTDQRQRCPVCLRLLANPTRIGGPSQSFLEWYGTELICTHGHGLLYVPEIPTSWYSTQRWQYLDPTWSSLFSCEKGSG